jgi:glucosyl-dolichyl phosphate glucuronosyltransferase
MTLSVTVAICTWNRAAQLREMLASLARLERPAGVDYEVLVIDNGSSDGTEAVLRDAARFLPLRSSTEPALGHAIARNRAVHESRGDYLLWTDDDVIVDSRWLQSHCEAFRADPEAALFGGPILPLFGARAPRWLEQVWDQVKGDYAVRDLGAEPVPLDHRRYPFGANYAIRREEQLRFPYDRRRGRRGTSLVSGDEVAVFHWLLAAGGRGWWVPGARVWHVIGRERLSRGFLRRYHEGDGRLAARLEPDRRGLAHLAGRGSAAVAHGARGCLRRAAGDADGWLDDLRKGARATGYVKERIGWR